MATGIPPRVRQTVTAISLFTIPLLLFGFFVLLQSEFREVRQLRMAVDASTQKRSELLRLLSLQQDIETGQRGYAITGDRAYLAPFDEARPRLSGSIAALRDDAKDDAAFEQSLNRIEAMSAERLALLQQDVAARDSGALAPGQHSAAFNRSKALMDAMRREVRRVDAIEAARLAVMTGQRDRSRGRIELTTNLMLAALSLLLAIVAAFTGHTMRARQAALWREQNLYARQQAIFSGAVDGMLVLDADGNILEMNPSITRLFGYPPEELVGRHNTVLMATPPSIADSQAWLRMVGAAGSRGAGERQEFRGLRNDGALLDTDVAISRVEGEGDRQYVAVIRDITERKRVESMKTEFVSTVSHELRTPLTSIGGSLGLLAAGAVGPLGEKAARLVSIAHSNCERLIRLINDILDIEKIESGKMHFDIRRMTLGPLIDRTIAANRGFAENHDITVSSAMPPWPIAVMGDPDRLEQLLTNLLSNAIKHSPKGAAVEVACLSRGAFARIEVRDRGAGVPPAFRERIFGKFAMADQSDSRTRGGTGLGLAIAREIAVRHGGSVDFRDRDGGGSVFYFDLPLAACDDRIVAPDDKLPLILHLDDDSDCLSVIESAFTDRATVISVAGMREAREAIERHRFAAAIVDVTVPPDNGLDLVPGLRAAMPTRPIVVFTAHDDVDNDDGIDAVFVKSRTAIETLVETTMALVERAEKEAA